MIIHKGNTWHVWSPRWDNSENHSIYCVVWLSSVAWGAMCLCLAQQSQLLLLEHGKHVSRKFVHVKERFPRICYLSHHIHTISGWCISMLS